MFKTQKIQEKKVNNLIYRKLDWADNKIAKGIILKLFNRFIFLFGSSAFL